MLVIPGVTAPAPRAGSAVRPAIPQPSRSTGVSITGQRGASSASATPPSVGSPFGRETGRSVQSRPDPSGRQSIPLSIEPLDDETPADPRRSNAARPAGASRATSTGNPRTTDRSSRPKGPMIRAVMPAGSGLRCFACLAYWAAYLVSPWRSRLAPGAECRARPQSRPRAAARTGGRRGGQAQDREADCGIPRRPRPVSRGSRQRPECPDRRQGDTILAEATGPPRSGSTPRVIGIPRPRRTRGLRTSRPACLLPRGLPS